MVAGLMMVPRQKNTGSTDRLTVSERWVALLAVVSSIGCLVTVFLLSKLKNSPNSLPTDLPSIGDIVTILDVDPIRLNVLRSCGDGMWSAQRRVRLMVRLCSLIILM